MSRFTHLIVHQRSAPPRQVRPTFYGSTPLHNQSLAIKKKGKKDRRQTRIYTRKRGSDQRDKEAHLDDFLVCASGREESGDAAAGRRSGLSTLITSPHPGSRLVEPREARYTKINFFLHSLNWFGGVFREPEPWIAGLFPPAPRSVGPGEFRERGPTRPLQSGLPSNDAFTSRRKISTSA